ncbi:MAG: hypothetical protein DI538_08195 [Azospira oryzae]|jgi:hypothetical protein|nr:MAG: hypothetical protein DI538_08195 [Azospira oryzae]
MNLLPEHQTVLKGLHGKGGTGNVNEFLAIGAPDFDRGFTVANDMQNLDLVKLLYSNFNKNLVVVEWTLLGESEFGKRV